MGKTLFSLPSCNEWETASPQGKPKAKHGLGTPSPYIAGSARFRLSPVAMQCAIPSMICWRWEEVLTKSNRWLLTVRTGLSAYVSARPF